jgi:hypothetical protein
VALGNLLASLPEVDESAFVPAKKIRLRSQTDLSRVEIDGERNTRRLDVGGDSGHRVRGGGVNAIGDGGQELVGVFLFVENAVEDLGCFVFAEELGPGAESAIDGDFVMLDLLGAGDEGDVTDGGVGCVLDVVFGFGDEGGDSFAGGGVGFAVVDVAEKGLDLGEVALGFGEVVAEGGGELGVGRLFNHGGQGLGDLLLHVKRLPEIGDVEGA